MFNCERLEPNYIKLSFWHWLLSLCLLSHNAVENHWQHRSHVSDFSFQSNTHYHSSQIILSLGPLKPWHCHWGLDCSRQWKRNQIWCFRISPSGKLKSSLVLREFLVYLGLRVPRTQARAWEPPDKCVWEVPQKIPAVSLSHEAHCSAT